MKQENLIRFDHQKRLRYHLNLLAKTIDEDRFPLEKLIIELDLDEDDIEWIDELFKRYTEKVKRGLSVNWSAFEVELIEYFGLTLELVLKIVDAFGKTERWPDVAAAYRSSHIIAD